MSTNICSYGCQNLGKFEKMGRGGVKKWSCSENIQHCPGMRSRHSQLTKQMIERHKDQGIYQQRLEKLSESRHRITENGKTIAQHASEKMVSTRKERNSFATGAKKSARTKKTKIDESTGLTIEKLAVIKANTTRMTLDSSGTSIAQRAGRKGIYTRMTTIDPETGLNSYELAELKSSKLKPYKSTRLHYASSYEFKWLEQLESIHGLDWVLSNVTRGPNFRYFDHHDNCMRNYPSDFRIGNTIYEIKSCYIFHKTPIHRQRNIIKLDTVLSQGYVVKLVLNFQEYDWAVDKDLILSIV